MFICYPLSFSRTPVCLSHPFGSVWLLKSHESWSSCNRARLASEFPSIVKARCEVPYPRGGDHEQLRWENIRDVWRRTRMQSYLRRSTSWRGWDWRRSQDAGEHSPESSVRSFLLCGWSCNLQMPGWRFHRCCWTCISLSGGMKLAYIHREFASSSNALPTCQNNNNLQLLWVWFINRIVRMKFVSILANDLLGLLIFALLPTG